MRKSMWLLSAGCFRLRRAGLCPAYDRSPPTPAAAPTEGCNGGSRRSGCTTSHRRRPAISSSPRRAVTKRCRTFRSRFPPSPPKRSPTPAPADIRQMHQVSPSLLVSSTSSEAGGGAARIRGIGTVGDNPGLESSVGVFIDGVYRSRTGVGLTELGAVDRIEVLRGPQGTLFGRNTSAGLISIITAKPKFNTEVAGEADDRQLQPPPLRASARPAADRHHRGPPRRHLHQARRLPGGRHLAAATSTIASATWSVARRCSSRPTIFSFRLIADYSSRDEECCAAPYLPRPMPFDGARRRDAANRRPSSRSSKRPRRGAHHPTTPSIAMSPSRRAAATRRRQGRRHLGRSGL